jgi:hypothetical protein
MRKPPIRRLYVRLPAFVAACALLSGAHAIAASGLKLETDPESVDRGEFGRFGRSLNVAAYGYEVIDDPTGTAPTPKIERFEVRPGDCHASAKWNDCKQDRERSELAERSNRAAVGTTAWYGWWLYVPKDWVNVYPAKVALGQFHQTEAHPVFMFQNGKGGLFLDDMTIGQSRRYYPLIAEEDLK